MVRRIIFLTLICFTGAGAAQAQTPPPPPPSRIAFGDGTWANLTPVFAQGKSVKLFSDNAAQATAVITLWVSSEGKQDWKIGPCDPTNPKIDKTVNQGKRAGGKAKRFTKPKTLIAAMKKENVPPSLQPWFLGELKNGREINRLVIQAPDDGHYASFKLSYSSPKLRVLGRGLVDRPAKGRVYVEPRIAKAVPTPKPPRKKTREEILIEKGLLSKPTPPNKTPASKTTSPPKTAPETKTPRAYAWHDGGWVSLTPDGRLLYNGLPAGRYVIQGKNGKHIITGMPGGPEKLTLWRKSQRLVGPHPRYGNDFVYAVWGGPRQNGRNAVVGCWKFQGGPQGGKVVKINLDGKLTAPGGAELGAWRWWGQEEYTFIWKDGKPDAAVISRDGNALSPSKTKASPGVAAVRSAPPTK